MAGEEEMVTFSLRAGVGAGGSSALNLAPRKKHMVSFLLPSAWGTTSITTGDVMGIFIPEGEKIGIDKFVNYACY